MEEQIAASLAQGLLNGDTVRRIALEFCVTERAVYGARRRVLDRLLLSNPLDRDRERLATMSMLDACTAASMNKGDFRAAFQGLRLRVDLLGLKGGAETTGERVGAAQTVEDLLRTIEEAGQLRERLSTETIHEDEE
jgi:hypothetical protein